MRGFTLIELMVVILIISVIAAIVGPTVFKKIEQSRRIAAKAQIEMFGVALDSYRLDNDTYPTTEQGLEALRKKPVVPPIPKNWDGPYLKKDIPLDPWGNPYVYICPGKVNSHGYDLVSYGSDGKAGGRGGAEDIVSWKGL
jgi:general secretion pathway protein G